MHEKPRCDNFKICQNIATRKLVQVYFWQGEVRKRTLQYCNECYEQLHGRYAENWLTRKRPKERNASDQRMRLEDEKSI